VSARNIQSRAVATHHLDCRGGRPTSPSARAAACRRNSSPAWDAPLLLITRGLAGSGKTSWADQEVSRLRADGVRAARVSRDDVCALAGIGRGVDEPAVTVLHHSLLRALLAADVRVVIADDTNIEDEPVRALREVGADAGARVQIVDHFLDVPLEVCITNDATRHAPHHVGADTITAMAATAPAITS
jgi:tRNA uridine 5-carbamoylmethylation protein Kti12